jgi:hypothetical protein
VRFTLTVGVVDGTDGKYVLELPVTKCGGVEGNIRPAPKIRTKNAKFRLVF